MRFRILPNEVENRLVILETLERHICLAPKRNLPALGKLYVQFQ